MLSPFLGLDESGGWKGSDCTTFSFKPGHIESRTYSFVSNVMLDFFNVFKRFRRSWSEPGGSVIVMEFPITGC
jgi:hypothetical protein